MYSKYTSSLQTSQFNVFLNLSHVSKLFSEWVAPRDHAPRVEQVGECEDCSTMGTS
jgi:hypothetical protein